MATAKKYLQRNKKLYESYISPEKRKEIAMDFEGVDEINAQLKEDRKKILTALRQAGWPI
ncbi:MAG: hypothetical protein R3E13_06830 [Alphaproteobacteria bacterium]